MVALDVDVPSVMGGSVTITHRIDGSSALFDCVGDDGTVVPERLQDFAFSTTFVANDDTYQAEVNAMKRFTFVRF